MNESQDHENSESLNLVYDGNIFNESANLGGPKFVDAREYESALYSLNQIEADGTVVDIYHHDKTSRSEPARFPAELWVETTDPEHLRELLKQDPAINYLPAE